MRTLKYQILKGTGVYKYVFYWAVWSRYICIVKEHKHTSVISWKVVRNVKLGRDLWGVIHRGSRQAGAVRSVSTISAWNTERIQWVKDQLAKP